MKINSINIEDYNYDLPDDRIAQYPVNERDMSQLLVLRGTSISQDTFKNLADYIPANSLLVFNNTRVIRARLLFKKETGAAIEILCLEPLSPKEYELSFSSMDPVEWKCIIGNLKKWKEGKITISFYITSKEYKLTVEKIKSEGEAWRIRFSWEGARISFGEVIEAAGHIPLPPYLNREDEKDDYVRYQTVYSSIKGSVAAPTAGLHFTDQVFESLSRNGIRRADLTLHVGAGTFQPVKAREVAKHIMHCEQFRVSASTISLLIENQGNIIGVGTTSVRTLESLYWLGIKISEPDFEFTGTIGLGQWEPYELVPTLTISESLGALLKMMKKQHISELEAATSIMIIPGYDFRVINGIITNFHQPCSTLLLLISAWIGERWKDVYNFALENNFRFLSYGDSSVLLR